MKTCNKCERAFELSGFHRDARSKDGHSGRCKICAIAGSRAHYAEHKPPPKARKARDESTWAKNDPAKRREWDVRYAEKNADAIAERKKVWRESSDGRAYHRVYMRNLRKSHDIASYERSRRERLTDGVVRAYLSAHRGIKAEFVSERLLEAKRQHLRLVRLLKERRK